VLPTTDDLSPPINPSDKKTVASEAWMKVANELWALIFSQGCKLFVLGACHCSLNNTELGTMISLAIFFQSKGLDYEIKASETKINMNYI
jgi:hypothetical protein